MADEQQDDRQVFYIELKAGALVTGGPVTLSSVRPTSVDDPNPGQAAWSNIHLVDTADSEEDAARLALLLNQVILTYYAKIKERDTPPEIAAMRGYRLPPWTPKALEHVRRGVAHGVTAMEEQLYNEAIAAVQRARVTWEENVLVAWEEISKFWESLHAAMLPPISTPPSECIAAAYVVTEGITDMRAKGPGASQAFVPVAQLLTPALKAAGRL